MIINFYIFKTMKFATIATLVPLVMAQQELELAKPEAKLTEALLRAISNPEKHSAKATDHAAFQIDEWAKNFRNSLGLDNLKDSKVKGLACSACKAAMKPATVLDNEYVVSGLEWLTKEICEALHIEGGDPSVCKGAINTMAGYLLPALVNGPLSPQHVCDEQMGVCSDVTIKELDVNAYVQKRLSEKPDIIKNNDFIDNIYKKIKADPNERKIRRSI